jgi:hypothetical protein
MHIYAGWVGRRTPAHVREYRDVQAAARWQVVQDFPEVFGKPAATSDEDMFRAVQDANSEGNYDAFLYIEVSSTGEVLTKKLW